MASQSDGGFALKFISGKYQGGEFPLKDNKQVVVGRSSDLDMVLVEDMVSRKHAKISMANGAVTIEDLGSTNGTFVNGEKVKSARLKEGDRILVGTSILKLIRTGPGGPILDDTQVRQRLEAAAATQSARQTKTAMTGKLEEVPLPDLLQLFHTSRKNGVLVIRSEMNARIYLKQGRVFHATIEETPFLATEKAFNRIVTWETGEFELLPPEEQEIKADLDASTEALLMEALRLYDEFRRIKDQLPPADASLRMMKPPQVHLRELSKEELDTLETVLQYGTLNGVMDNTPHDDVVCAQSVLALVKKGVVEAVE